MAQAAAKVEASAGQREVPVIKPKGFQWQYEGFVWREAFIRLPAGLVAQDIQDAQSTIWQLIQGNRATALRKFDRVVCVAFDESWQVEAVVGSADQTRVVLVGSRVVKLPGCDAEFEDTIYRIAWGGPGFVVSRKSDGVQMIPQFFETVEAAKAEMYRQLYSAKVA